MKSLFYYAAITLASLTLHLFSVTALESFAWVSNLTKPERTSPSFYFTDSGSQRMILSPERVIPKKSTDPVESILSTRSAASSDLRKMDQEYQKSQELMDQKIEAVLAQLNQQEHEMRIARMNSSGGIQIQKVSNIVMLESLPLYLMRMRSKIARIWIQSLDQAGLNAGDATVEFMITSQGAVSQLVVSDFSGSQVFVRNCREAIKNASPFDILPIREDLPSNDPSLEVKLTFHLREMAGSARTL